MTRTYDAQAMVVLPVLDADSISTLAGELLAVAKKEEKHLTERVLDARDELAAAKTALDLERNKALSPEPAASAKAQDPDKEEEDAWDAGEKMLNGAQTLPSDTDRPAIAARVYNSLYGKGLGFLRGSPHKRWAGTQNRIEVIQKSGLAKDFAELGFKDLLATIEAKHRATGIAHGFTTALPATETAHIRTAYDNTKGALREYVLQATASANKKKAATVTLAQALLNPLVAYEAPARSKPSKAAGGAENAAKKKSEDTAAKDKADASHKGPDAESVEQAAAPSPAAP
jgi:hypothetical protein